MEDYSYIICPNSVKEKILKDNKGLLHLKFITKNDLLKNTYFDYDYRAIYYIHKKYGYNFDNAKEILDNLTTISSTKKLETLSKIYQDLKDNNLLIFNNYFALSFVNYKVKILGYSYNDIEIKSALDKLNLKYEYLEENNQSYHHQLITFKSIDEEVLYNFNQVASLLENGISLNNIYFYKLPSEYELIIKKLSNFYALPIECLESIKLYDSPLYKKFTTFLLEEGYQKAYQHLSNETPSDTLLVLPKLASILIKLSSLKIDKEELLPILNYVAKNTTLKNVSYKQSIKICDSLSLLGDDDYIFIFGFSLNNYPSICKDIDFLTDEEKTIVNKNTSSTLNLINKELLSSFITKHKNVFITLNEKLGKIKCLPSLLVNELKLEIEKGILDNKRYSLNYAMLETATYKDIFYKYHKVNKYIDEFKDTLEYKSFSHLFKGVNTNKKDKLILSYSQLNEYYNCAFMYFVKRILKANIFEEKFELKLGTLFHTILEDSLTKTINLNDYKPLIEETFTTNKELFFVNLLLPQIKDVLNKINHFHNTTKYSLIKGEYEFNYQLDEVTIVGKADKIMIDEENKKAIIVDYKTKKDTFAEWKVKYGLNMQLPLYATLIKDEFPDIELTGMFLQNILADTRETKDTSLDQLYLLAGMGVDDASSFKRLDTTIEYKVDENRKVNNLSQFIKGYKIKKDESISGGKSKKEFDDLIETAFTKTKEAITSIKNQDFTISPKGESHQISNLPCQYCECFDICFRKTSDVVLISRKKGEDDEL